MVLVAVLLATLWVAPADLATRAWESLAALFDAANWMDIFGGDSYFDANAAAFPAARPTEFGCLVGSGND